MADQPTSPSFLNWPIHELEHDHQSHTRIFIMTGGTQQSESNKAGTLGRSGCADRCCNRQHTAGEQQGGERQESERIEGSGAKMSKKTARVAINVAPVPAASNSVMPASAYQFLPQPMRCSCRCHRQHHRQYSRRTRRLKEWQACQAACKTRSAGRASGGGTCADEGGGGEGVGLRADGARGGSSGDEAAGGSRTNAVADTTLSLKRSTVLASRGSTGGAWWKRPGRRRRAKQCRTGTEWPGAD